MSTGPENKIIFLYPPCARGIQRLVRDCLTGPESGENPSWFEVNTALAGLDHQGRVYMQIGRQARLDSDRWSFFDVIVVHYPGKHVAAFCRASSLVLAADKARWGELAYVKRGIRQKPTIHLSIWRDAGTTDLDSMANMIKASTTLTKNGQYAAGICDISGVLAINYNRTNAR